MVVARVLGGEGGGGDVDGEAGGFVVDLGAGVTGTAVVGNVVTDAVVGRDVLGVAPAEGIVLTDVGAEVRPAASTTGCSGV